MITEMQSQATLDSNWVEVAGGTYRVETILEFLREAGELLRRSPGVLVAAYTETRNGWMFRESTEGALRDHMWSYDAFWEGVAMRLVPFFFRFTVADPGKPATVEIRDSAFDEIKCAETQRSMFWVAMQGLED